MYKVTKTFPETETIVADSAYKTPHICKKVFDDGRVLSTAYKRPQTMAFYTNGQSVCLTELRGYQAAVGQPVIQPRRPNNRLDKVRHMFQDVYTRQL